MLEDIKIIHLKSNAQRLETWIAMLNGEIVGHIYMEREEKNKIKFLDAWVHEEHRLKEQARARLRADKRRQNKLLESQEIINVM